MHRVMMRITTVSDNNIMKRKGENKENIWLWHLLLLNKNIGMDKQDIYSFFNWLDTRLMLFICLQSKALDKMES